ncbi:MAG: DNA cytosine methyltransferase [Betaproteobacteria bacterium]|nr:DNA cytosine methyltransferase [Betaproteobacteria bacterium]
MSRRSVARSVSNTQTPTQPAAKRAQYSYAKLASASTTIAKEGERRLERQDVRALIQFARHGGQWIAEFRVRMRCGAFESTTLPLTPNSTHHASETLALDCAAKRMLEALAMMFQGRTLTKIQQRAVAAVQAWASQFLVPDQPVEAPSPEKTAPRFLDVFSGIGGFHIGLDQAGAVCAGSVELCPEARKTYAANHPGNYPVCDDIRKATAQMFGQVDIVCGGFPCQSISVAGDGKGLTMRAKAICFSRLHA